jgi:hypothetical protein
MIMFYDLLVLDDFRYVHETHLIRRRRLWAWECCRSVSPSRSSVDISSLSSITIGDNSMTRYNATDAFVRNVGMDEQKNRQVLTQQPAVSSSLPPDKAVQPGRPLCEGTTRSN